jgi:lipoprotein
METPITRPVLLLVLAAGCGWMHRREYVLAK